MTFQPQINQELTIDHTPYHVAEHPAASGIPYGQEGRAATVYKLVVQDGEPQALKVFKPRHRLPALVGQAAKIAPLAELPGLSVCRRIVLSARRHGELLRQHPDLTYAVLMPWIEGPTWMEVMGRGGDPSWSPMTPDQSLTLARTLVEILATMEERGLAHCDLSGSNLLFPALIQPPTSNFQSPIALVDVEQLYSSDLKRPEVLTVGSDGYAHRSAPQDLWGSAADRFAGAVLLGEMLGRCDERVREAAWGESYFDLQEVQRGGSERYELLVDVMRERWGAGAARLFKRAWRSDLLVDCATFGEWLVTLPEEVPVVEAAVPAEEAEGEQEKALENEGAIQTLIELARQFEEQGNLESALQTYRQVQTLVPAESGLAEELALIVRDVEARQAEAAIPEPEPPMEEVEAESPTAEPQPVEEAAEKPVAHV